MATQTAAWPEGVIARYLTKAAEITGNTELTVDVAEEPNPHPEQEGYRVTCRGCDDSTLYNREAIEAALARTWVTAGEGERLAREWAQEHAERCRALLRPTT